MKTWQIGALVAAALALFLFSRKRGGTVAAAITSILPGAFPTSTAPPTSPYEPAVSGSGSVPTSTLPPVPGQRTAYRPPLRIAPSVGPAVTARKGRGSF